MRQQITLFTKPVIFVVISFLGVALIYSSSSTFDVFGEIKKSEIDCIPESGNNIVHCCYKEYDSESGDTVAIYCATCYDNGGSLACDAYDKVYSIKPDDIPPTPPTGGKGIFGSNILPSPSTSPGEEVPNDGEVVEQPPTTPTAPPTGPTVVPENDQDTNDGGEKPPRGNDVVPDKGITEQPEAKQPEEPSNEGQDTAGPLT